MAGKLMCTFWFWPFAGTQLIAKNRRAIKQRGGQSLPVRDITSRICIDLLAMPAGGTET
ncbi:hypothetical protein [Bradyrhizobium macuxiense]|uniref:hypothetical protein n=1 Tax=Bradyrhizobium macuxiense TaxID=1755647 RepID=UPI00142ED408|nr:hypothetical protein [Bradyrhizobium macuxiense]